MEITEGENWKPSSLIRAHSMNQHKRRSELVVVTTRDHIHYTCGVFDSIIPKCAGHLFLSEVGASHVDHYLPMRFHKAFHRLSTSWDRRAFKVKKQANMAAKKFLVAITSKLTCKIPSFGAKGQKSRDNIIVMEQFKSTTPIKPRSPILKYESIFKTHNRHALSKGDIDMHYIQVF